MTAAGEPPSGARAERRLLARLWRHIVPHWPILAVIFVLIGISALIEGALPYLLKVAIDSHIALRNGDGLLAIVLVLGGGIIGRTGVRMAIAYALAVLGQRTMYDLRRAVHAHLLGRNAAFFNRNQVGRLLAAVTQDVESVNQMFTGGVITVVADLIVLVTIVVTMLYLSVKLTLITLAIVPPLLVVLTWSRRLMRRSYRAVGERQAALSAYIVEHITGLKTVQVFCRQRRTVDDCDRISGAYRDAALTSLRAGVTVPVCDAAAWVSCALVLWYVGAEAGVASIGLVVAFTEYANRFYAPISTLAQKHVVMQTALVGCERIFGLLDSGEPDAPPLPAGEVPATPVAADSSGSHVLQLRDVHFAYRPGEPVLRGVSLGVRAETCVAVVGATGAGKSTLVRLLARYYDPESGAVLVDGRDVRDWRIDQLRGRLTVVQQDVFLFSGTVADNVRVGRPDASLEAVERALVRVGGTRLLEREGGVHAEIAERGANLSAGERQLVAFARALIRDPEILILDEATANVDPETEQTIERALVALSTGRTSLVIAHRLSTIRRADRIVVMANGQIAEQGTRSELIAANGLYARLEQQMQHR